LLAVFVLLELFVAVLLLLLQGLGAPAAGAGDEGWRLC
jgi:hypothetical protein